MQKKPHQKTLQNNKPTKQTKNQTYKSTKPNPQAPLNKKNPNHIAVEIYVFPLWEVCEWKDFDLNGFLRKPV